MPWTRIFGQMNMTRDEILKKLEENRETIRGFEVRRLGIFGSYARDEHTKRVIWISWWSLRAPRLIITSI